MRMSKAPTPEHLSEMIQALGVNPSIDHQNTIRFGTHQYDGFDWPEGIKWLQYDLKAKFGKRISKRKLREIIEATAQRV